MISVTFGDTSGGSPGWQMQTSCEERFEIKVLVDPIATYQFKELASSPITQIVPGNPVRAVCLAPSQVLVSEDFTYYLKLEDEWGNPTQKPHQLIHLGWKTAGVQTIIAEDKEMNLSARSNPIDVLTEDTPLHPY